MNAYGVTQGPQLNEDILKQKFTQMAFSALSAKFSELMPQVITFKIMNVMPDAGSGQGVFIVDLNSKPVYIPVILNESKLKPLEVMYYKQLNMFLPLDMSWMEEISKMTLDEMGEAERLPNEVARDVNISGLVYPPNSSGRYGYASCEFSESGINNGCEQMLKTAKELHELPDNNFLTVLSDKASSLALDGIKLAFDRNRSTLIKFAEYYGVNNLTSAFQKGYARCAQTVKTASASSHKGDIFIFDKNTSPTTLKQHFEKRAGEAYTSILKSGMLVKDTRKGLEKVAVKIENNIALVEPGLVSGWYRLYFIDQDPKEYFVIPNPIATDHYVVGYVGQDNSKKESLVISADGKETWVTKDVVGQPLKDASPGKITSAIDGSAGDTPKIGSFGFYLNKATSGSVSVTCPFLVKTISNDGGITKMETTDGYTICVDKDPSRKNFQRIGSASILFVPTSAKFIEVKQVKKMDDYWEEMRGSWNVRKNSILKDPQMIYRWMNNLMQDSGAVKPEVKTAGSQMWWVNKSQTPLNYADALTKVAKEYSLSIEDSHNVLRNSIRGNSSVYVLPKVAAHKFISFKKTAAMQEEGPMAFQSAPGGAAQGMPPDAAMQQSGGQQFDMSGQQPGGQVDPMAAGGQLPPGAMPPMPAVSATDLAIGEAVQQLEQQTMMTQQQLQSQMEQLQQQLSMQSSNNEQLVSVLKGIQDRSKQIASATGGMIPPEAMASPMVAAQELAPPPPVEEPPPPMPMMDQQGTSPEMVASQINPEMADRAGELKDSGVFDTASVAMLGSAPVLQEIVASYVPSIEKAIDNLGRILLSLWMKESETKKNIGDEAFYNIEDKVRTMFKGLGDCVLNLSHNAVNTPDDATRSRFDMQA